MSLRKPILTAAVASAVLGAVVLTPVVAQAAEAAPSVSTVASTSSSPVTGVQQREAAGRVFVSVSVRDAGAYILRSADGTVLGARTADASKPASFLLSGSGNATETFTFTRQDGSGATPITVQFGANALAAPTDTTSYPEQLVIRRGVLAGNTTQTIRYQGQPGAVVTAVVNGVASSATAGPDGIAAVQVQFRAGSNDVAVSQRLGDVQSPVKTSGYQF